MKKAFLISSSISVDNSHKLTYSNERSCFSNEERFRHTAYTIASLDSLRDNENCTFFLIDTSPNFETYKNILRYQTNLRVIGVKEEFPEIFEVVNTHPNKSFCETLIIYKFLEKYKETLLDYDYIIKLSGRYFIDGSADISVFNEENLDKFLFKTPLKFEWNDNWNYQIVDLREQQKDNMIYQYPSVLYGFGKQNLRIMMDIYKVILAFTSHKNGIKYDIETLIYFFTRQYEKQIIELDWKVYGWAGANGTYLRY